MPGRTTKDEAATQDADMEDAPPSAQPAENDAQMEAEEQAEEEEEEEIEPQRVRIVRRPASLRMCAQQ